MATQTDKVNTGALGTLTAVGATALVAIYFALTALVRHEETAVADMRAEGSDAEVQKLKTAQREKLNRAPGVSGGHISVPIERAMEVVVADLQRDPRSATPAPPPDAGADAALELAPPEGAADAGATEGQGEGAASGDAGAAETPKPETAPEEKKDEIKKKPKVYAPQGGTIPAPVAPQEPQPEPTRPAPAPAPVAPTDG